MLGCGGGASTASAALAPLRSILGGIMGVRQPVLPTQTRGKPGCTSPVGRRKSVRFAPVAAAGGLGKKRRRWERGASCAALVLLLVATAAACTVVVALSCYALSIIYEPADVLAAAAAEAQAAVAAAAAATAAVAAQIAGAEGSQRIPLAGVAEQRWMPANSSYTSRYTVVVMSYGKRLSTLPLVINKLGSCPSVAEVLLVWNDRADPPPPELFDCTAPVRIRQEAQNDLSNRMHADPDITTAAVFLADDDVLLRCADVERAFAKWQANRQALVGFFPRLVTAGPPPQYLPERVVFRQRQFNVLLTAAEFVGVDVLELYWSERYRKGRELVRRLLNCEDVLLNFVAASAIQEQQQQHWMQEHEHEQGLQQHDSGLLRQQAAAGNAADGSKHRKDLMAQRKQHQQEQEQQEILQYYKQQQQQKQQRGQQRGRLPHVVWAQPSRRLDLSSLSGVGISKAGSSHIATRAQCVAQFEEWYGRGLLQVEDLEWERSAGSRQRMFQRPLCRLPFMGCVYL